MSDEFSAKNFSSQIDRLIAIMARLRDPQDGCPWDLKQDFKTLVPYTIEESYEVAEAIEHGDMDAIKKELGDLLFQVVFYSQLGTERNSFDFEQVAQAICEKMLYRHPHVFADHQYENVEAFEKDWQKRKELEKQTEQQTISLMDDISQTLPAMTRAVKIQKRAAQVGFDWDNAAEVLSKVKEEVTELKEAMEHYKLDSQNEETSHQIEEELGDLLFSCVNLSRKLKLDPETVLRKSNSKFMQRFQKMEQQYGCERDKMEQATLEDLELLWQKAKQL